MAYRSSGMHFCTLDDFIRHPFFRPQSNSHNLCIIWRKLAKNFPIGGVVPGGKHFLYIKRCGHAAFQCATMNLCDCILIRCQNDGWLSGQRIINILVAINIGFPDNIGVLGNDAAHQKGRDIQQLPIFQIVAKNNGDFGIKHLCIR